MPTAVSTASPGWYELRPFFEPADEKYNDMHELVMKVKEFSHFTVRSNDGMIRSFLHLPLPADAGMAPGMLKNAIADQTSPKAFSAPLLLYLKTKRHYALPVHHELLPPLLHSTIEKISRACFIAVTAKYHDESYSVAQYVEKQLYARPPLADEIFRMFTGSTNTQQKNTRSTTSAVVRQSRADLAKEKQRLRHFHCNIAIGAESVDTAKSLMKVLSFDGDGFAIAEMERDSMYRMEVKKKPLFFADHFCVLSDIELANIISLPDDPRAARFNVSRKGTYTTGPSMSV
jgi:hypothetical protein